MKLKNVSTTEIQADLKTIELELQEVMKLKGKKKRTEWAEKHPESWTKIYNICLKYEIQEAIEILEELRDLAEERFGPEKRHCEAILSRSHYYP